MAGAEWMTLPSLPTEAEALAEVQSRSFRSAYLTRRHSARNDKVIQESRDFMTYERVERRQHLIAEANENPDEQFYYSALNGEDPVGLLYGTQEELVALYVDPAFKNRGVGRSLMQRYVEWVDPTKPIELGVVDFNRPAQRFYAKMGFQMIGPRENSFYTFLNELTMVRPPQEEI